MNERKEYIEEYTREDFFFEILNQALRRLKTPLDSYCIRQPFQDIFLSVLELYHNQESAPFRKNDFPCYRACTLSDD